MWQFLFEGVLTIGGVVLTGNAIKLGLKWAKYGVKKLSPPEEKKGQKEEPKTK